MERIPTKHKLDSSDWLALALPFSIALAGIAIVQFHGAPFWAGLFDSFWIGGTVSLTWEAASIWLWWRGDKRFVFRAAKWLATCALLFAMVAQTAGPILTIQETATVQAKNIEEERKRYDQLMVLAVDQERRGWKDAIDATLARLRQLEQQAGNGDANTLLPAWAMTILAWVPVVTFPGLYAIALLALVTTAESWRHLREPRHIGRSAGSPVVPNNDSPVLERDTEPERENSVGSPVPESGHPNTRERRLIKGFAVRHRLSRQGDVADAIDEPRSTLSEFANGRLSGGPYQRIERKLMAGTGTV